ncbi:Hypothetical protein FKW44_008976, partial [Caligus rogercresseyi]
DSTKLFMDPREYLVFKKSKYTILLILTPFGIRSKGEFYHWRPLPPDHHRCRLLHPVNVSGVLWDLGDILAHYAIILRTELIFGLEKFIIIEDHNDTWVVC